MCGAGKGCSKMDSARQHARDFRAQDEKGLLDSERRKTPRNRFTNHRADDIPPIRYVHNVPTLALVRGVLGRGKRSRNPAAYMPDAVVPLANGAPGDATGYGNAPRNCIIGPPQKNVDFTVGKTFKLTERQSLRFRTDFFNLFNHPSFANPSATDVESPCSFTQITSVVGTPRLIQFSLKYSF